MNFVSMIFGWGGGSSIGVIPLDALLSEKTSLNSRATEYAVEDGPPVSDHVVQESEVLAIDGWVTAATVSLFLWNGRQIQADRHEGGAAEDPRGSPPNHSDHGPGRVCRFCHGDV